MMKLNKRFLAGLVGGTMLLGAAGGAIAYGGYHQGMCGDCHGSPTRAIERLEGLSDEQREQLEQLFSQQRGKMKTQMVAMREGRAALQQALSEGASLEAIRKLATEQGEMVTSMIMARAEMQSKLGKILSEDQLQQLQKQRPMMMQRHKPW